MSVERWALTGVAVATGAAVVIGHLLDQVPKLARKAVLAIRALRSVRRELRGDEEGQ